MSENLRISLGLRAYVCVCLRDRRGGAVSFIRPGPIFREACPNTVCSLPDLLRALAELRKAATVSFVMSVHAEQFGLPPNGLFWNLIFEDFSKIYAERASLIKIWEE